MGQLKSRSIACAIFMFMFSAACGTEEKSEMPAGQGGMGGGTPSGGTGGMGGTGGGIAPLPDATAGKACASDTECAPGTCAQMVEGLDGMPIAAPGGYCMGTCVMSTDCGAGGTCVTGLMGSATCYDGCMADTDCREGYLCGPLTMTCRPAPPTDQLADNVAGVPCAMDTECGDGVCFTTLLNGDPFPGGYCSGACLMDSHCGAGGVCWRQGAAAGRCYDSCAADPDCTRDGYRCRAIEDLMGCLPTPDPLPDNMTGIACASDADCGGAADSCALMLPAAGGGEVAAPGGYCTIACEIDLDCGAGGVCVVTRVGGRCFDPCAMASECREGYVCGERGGMAMPSIVCTPFEPPADGGMPELDGSVPVSDAGP